MEKYKWEMESKDENMIRQRKREEETGEEFTCGEYGKKR